MVGWRTAKRKRHRNTVAMHAATAMLSEKYRGLSNIFCRFRRRLFQTFRIFRTFQTFQTVQTVRTAVLFPVGESGKA